MAASAVHQRKPAREMHRHFLHTSKTDFNNDTRDISDFRSMSESRVKSCNNYVSSSSGSGSSSSGGGGGGVSPQGDLQFSRSSLDGEKYAIDLHTLIATTRPESSSASCHCTTDRHNECFVDDCKCVPSGDSNNLTGEHQKWNHRLTTSELLSHTRPAKKGSCDVNSQQSVFCRNVNSRSRFNTWRTVLAICIALLCTVCNANQDPTTSCAQGLSTPGWTMPQGDIVLEYGQDLRILCILNKDFVEENYPGKNASDVYFFHSGRVLEPEYITILNETTVEMFVEKPPAGNDMYYCRLRLDDDGNKSKFLSICLNEVVIGYKPQEPKNFSCISYNWEKMVCTWEPEPNFVSTRFSLVFKLPGRAGRKKLYPCPQQDPKKELNYCMWDASTNPIYRQPYPFYTLFLTGENVLGNITVPYKFHHYANVIPNKPANFTLVNKTSESAFLFWSPPYPMSTFPPGLYFRLTYQNQWDSQKSWQVINFTDEIQRAKRYYNLTGLRYANSVYDVRVYAKSADAAGDDRWSNFSDITFRTLPKLPGLAPATDIGSFEIIENNGFRDVYLYWQTIPPYQENGGKFRYQIIRVEENGRKVSLQPVETTRTYAKFKELTIGSYQFEIATSNEVGQSKNSSKIFIPSRTELPREPITFTKIAFDGGTYELSWKYPDEFLKEVTNYTIFWCDNERDRPYQCTGYLDWMHVSWNTSVYNMTVPDPKKVYQFAISANTKHASSGMVWASCTVIHNRVASKMKSLWINKIGSDYIEVGWKLDCSDRVGNVEGFNIYYCPIIAPYNRNCKELKLNTTIKADPSTIRGVIHGLKPYTTYKLTVSVLSKHGEGPHSDPLYNTTLEAPPTTPPQDVRVLNSTNTTLVVTWKPPIAMNGVLRYYEVYYNSSKKSFTERVDEANHAELPGITHGNHSIKVTLSNLSAHEEYSIEVAACTVTCSAKSKPVRNITKIGTPGKINIPSVRFINSSQVLVKWRAPQNAAGLLDYYQISSSDGDIRNSTVPVTQLPIADCKTIGREKMYQFRVRAVNVVGDEHLIGPWSEAGEGNCYSDRPSNQVLMVIWVIGILSAVALVLCVIYTSKRTWLKCRYMRDVDVKLPHGIEPNMKLLQKVGEQHTRQSSADSSGCSSGHESVTSSLTSESHVSSDSGADVDPIAVSPNKLLELPAAWNPTSLRQRNVGTARPGGTADSARWDPYMKAAKTGEPIIADTLSIARSTPNLSDSTGSTTSQHTWSSTGYMSMPSSEEISNNPSPIPQKESTNLGGYSVVSMMPPPGYTSEEDSGKKTISATDAKPSNPYVSLASLEQKTKAITTIVPLPDFDDITFPEMEESSNLDTFSDKVPKDYVQSAFVDYPEKPQVSFAPTLLSDSCSSPLVSTSPATTHLTPDTSSKPYVSHASIPNFMNPPRVATGTDDLSSKPYVTLDSTPNSIFQMLQQQRIKADLDTTVPEVDTSDLEIDVSEEEDSSNYTICWKPKPEDEAKTEDKSRGYVMMAENPKLENQLLGKQKSSPQSEEQYSQVTIAPGTMQ